MWLCVFHIECDYYVFFFIGFNYSIYRLPLSVFSFQFTAILIATTDEFNYLRYTAGKHCLKYIPSYTKLTKINSAKIYVLVRI